MVMNLYDWSQTRGTLDCTVVTDILWLFLRNPGGKMEEILLMHKVSNRLATDVAEKLNRWFSSLQNITNEKLLLQDYTMLPTQS